jgi:hypothetical protein
VPPAVILYAVQVWSGVGCQVIVTSGGRCRQAGLEDLARGVKLMPETPMVRFSNSPSARPRYSGAGRQLRRWRDVPSQLGNTDQLSVVSPPPSRQSSVVGSRIETCVEDVG